MFEDKVLTGLRVAPASSAVPSAIRVQLRLPWYRSLPLACIERLDLSIDGKAQATDSLTIVINGARHPLSGVYRLRDAWWFVLDSIDVELGASVSLVPGKHQVGVALGLQIPYGDPDFRPQLNIRQLAECTKELTLAGGDE